MKRMNYLLAGILIVSMLLGACVTTETPTAAPTNPPATRAPPAGGATDVAPTEATAPEPVIIKIGALYPLTGAGAATGIASKEAIEFAADIVNNSYPDLNLPLASEAGLPNLGGAKIEVIFADHQMDPEIGASETERLITEEQVVAIVGAYASSVTATASQAAERLGIPFVNAQSTSPP